MKIIVKSFSKVVLTVLFSVVALDPGVLIPLLWFTWMCVSAVQGVMVYVLAWAWLSWL